VATTSAPVASATPPEEDTRVKSQKTSSQTGRKEPGPALNWRAFTTAAVCTAAAGCPGVPVRPPPVDCPPETVSFMREKLGIRPGDYATAVIDSDKSVGSVPIAVPAGDIESELTDDLGRLPGEDERVLVRGQLFFGKDRIYGRYTEAILPDFTSFPVCLQLHDRTNGTLGVPKLPGSGPGAALILNGGYVQAVQRFE
jgi:serine/threonine-protein kinase